MKTAPYKLEVGSQSVPVGFVRNAKARRYILRLVSPGAARVTIPRGGTMQAAIEFARKNARWIEKQLRRTPAAWGEGTPVFYRGVPFPLRVENSPGGLRVSFHDLVIDLSSGADLRSAIEARLKMIAIAELPVRVLQLALEHGLEVRSVQVRDQRSRWGSASVRRNISLNWRLVQTPDFVRDYIIVHELMHLKEMNHSARFWAHVAAAIPAYRDAERWLRQHSRLLR